MNLLVGMILSAFLAHVAWFGVVQKHGCCCLVICCCLGQPNLLVTAIISALFGILTIISVIQPLGSVQGALIVVVLIGAVFAVIHATALIYVGFEAFMIWRLCSNSAAGSGQVTSKQEATGEAVVVGAAEAAGKPAVDIEAVSISVPLS